MIIQVENWLKSSGKEKPPGFSERFHSPPLLLIPGSDCPRAAEPLLNGFYSKQFFVEELKPIKRIWLRFTHQKLPINTLMVTQNG